MFVDPSDVDVNGSISLKIAIYAVGTQSSRGLELEPYISIRSQSNSVRSALRALDHFQSMIAALCMKFAPANSLPAIRAIEVYQSFVTLT